MSGKSTLKRAWSVRGHFTPCLTIFNRKLSSKTTGLQRDGKLKSIIHSAATTYESEWNIHEGSIPFTRSIKHNHLSIKVLRSLSSLEDLLLLTPTANASTKKQAFPRLSGQTGFSKKGSFGIFFIWLKMSGP
jgi:hypothetical protein